MIKFHNEFLCIYKNPNVYCTDSNEKPYMKCMQSTNKEYISWLTRSVIFIYLFLSSITIFSFIKDRLLCLGVVCPGGSLGHVGTWAARIKNQCNQLRWGASDSAEAYWNYCRGEWTEVNFHDFQGLQEKLLPIHQ